MIRTIVFIIFWFASLVGCAQTTDLLYVFPSKEVYETGEDMWFKAYLMDRQTFVEAIDGNGLMGCQTFTFRVIRNK